MYTVEYYSAIKNKLMPFAATWMNLETMLSQRKTNTQYHLGMES